MTSTPTPTLAQSLIQIDASIARKQAKTKAAKAPAPAPAAPHRLAQITRYQSCALAGLAQMGVDIKPAILLSGADLDNWLAAADDALCAAEYAGLQQATADHAAAHAELLASFAQWQQRRII